MGERDAATEARPDAARGTSPPHPAGIVVAGCRVMTAFRFAAEAAGLGRAFGLDVGWRRAAGRPREAGAHPPVSHCMAGLGLC